MASETLISPGLKTCGVNPNALLDVREGSAFPGRSRTLSPGLIRQWPRHKQEGTTRGSIEAAGTNFWFRRALAEVRRALVISVCVPYNTNIRSDKPHFPAAMSGGSTSALLLPLFKASAHFWSTQTTIGPNGDGN